MMALPAWSATFTWNGDAVLGPEWTRDNNWAGNTAPPSNGTADLIFAGTVRLDATADQAYNILSLTFNSTAGAFDLSGSALTIGSGGITNQDNSEQDISNSIVLSAAQTFNTTSTGGLDLNGNVNTNGNLLTVDSNTGQIRFFGVISGGGGITKTGSGTMIMSNGANNTYSGTTTVAAGNVQLGLSSEDTGFVKVPGALTINGGNVNVAFDEQIANTSTVTVNSPGTFGLLSGVSESINTLILNGSSASGADASLTITNSLTMTGGTMLGGGGTLILSGNITTLASVSSSRILLDSLNLNGSAHSVTVNDGAAAVDLEITSAISNGTLTKAGSGVLRLGGSTANTNAAITVNGGTLELNKTVGINAVGGTLSIGTASSVVRLLKNDQIANTSDITVGPGTFDLNGFSETVDAVSLGGGTITTGAGTLTAGNVSTTGTGGLSSISGNLNLGGATRTYNVADETGFPADLIVFAVVSNGSLTKTGTGTLLLSGVNTFAGTLTLTGGELAIGNDAALGTAGLSIGTGTTIRSDAAAHALANPTTISGDFTIGGSDDLTLSGPVSLPADRTITVSNTGASTISGVISQSGGTRGLTKIGAGTLAFAGTNANTYTGTTTVNAGILELRKPAGVAAIAGPVSIGNGTGSAVVRLFANEQISPSVAITVNASGALSLNGFTQTVGALTLNTGDVSGGGLLMLAGNLTSGGTGLSEVLVNVNLAAGARTLDVADTSGVIDLTLNGSIANGSIIKTGAGTLRLVSSTSTFTGGVTLNAGELAIFGSLGSGPLTMNAGTIRSDDAVRSLANPVTVAGDFSVGGAFDLTLSGATTLTGTRTITINNTALTAFSGAIGEDAGGRALIKTGAGTLRLSGTANNTYTGATIVNSGILLLAKTGGAFAITGSTLTIGDSTGGASADVVRLEAASNISPTTAITIQSSGVLDFNGFNQALGTLTLSGGRVTTGAGSATLGATVTSQPSSTGASIEGSVDLAGDTRTFNIGAGAAADDLTITASIANGSLTKSGAGTLVLAGTTPNTFTGTTSIDGGTLELAKTPGQNAITGQLNLAGGTTVRLRANNQIADTSTVTTGSFSSFILNNFSDTIGGLSMNGGDVSTGLGTLTITGNVLTSVSGGNVPTISGNLNLGGAVRTFNVIDDLATTPDFNVPAVVSNGGINKTGAGTLRLSGNSPAYTGSTMVNAGVLLVSGNISGSPLTVNNGAILGGVGTAGPTSISTGATLSPGESAGTLTTGNLLLEGGAISLFELKTPGVVGGVNDLISVNGALTLDGTLAVTELAGFGSGIYRLFNYTGSLQNNGLDLQPAFLAAHQGSFIDLGSPGQVNLVVVPEPTTAALLSFGVLALARRRR